MSSIVRSGLGVSLKVTDAAVKVGVGNRFRVSAQSWNILPRPSKPHLPLSDSRTYPNFLFVLLSLLSLGLPGQQQHPQVISLLPPSACSALPALCPSMLPTALGPQYSSSALLLCPLSFSPFTEIQALPKLRPGWGSLCHPDSQLSHFAFQLGAGRVGTRWWERKSRLRALWGSPLTVSLFCLQPI